MNPLLIYAAIGFGSFFSLALIVIAILWAVRNPIYNRKQHAKLNELADIQSQAYIAIQKELGCAGWATKLMFRLRVGKPAFETYRP